MNIKLIEFMYKYLLCVETTKQSSIVLIVEGLVIILLRHHSFQYHTLRLQLHSCFYLSVIYCFISVIKNYRFKSYISISVYWDTLQSVLDNLCTTHQQNLLYQKVTSFDYEIKQHLLTKTSFIIPML